MRLGWETIAIVISFALILYAAGCENSENPASDPKEAEPVPELHGIWRTQWSDDEVQYFHVGRAGGEMPESMLRVELVTHKKDGDLVTHDQLMVVIPGGTDERPILSAAAVDRDNFAMMQKEGWDPESAGDYFLYTYRIDEEKLFLRGVDRNEKRRLIEAGKTEGIIKEPEGRFTWTRIRLTASTGQLAEFLNSPAAESFFAEDEHPLVRIDEIEWSENDIESNSEDL